VILFVVDVGGGGGLLLADVDGGLLLADVDGGLLLADVDGVGAGLLVLSIGGAF
jgi:hypothetical protein